MATVNLDALILREDFEAADADVPGKKVETIAIGALENKSFFYSSLRKPDFQRETSDWDAPKIREFLESFLDGDLIPAIILWQENKFVFVIDGAHRLSALISWVQDDYGDGINSKAFFEYSISADQLKAAERTRKLIDKHIGAYKEYLNAAENPEKADPKILSRARKLATLSLQIQWVTGGASKAEASFFKINQAATPIDKTELKLLKSRHKPNALAARAIIHAGTGHKYWSKFSENEQADITKIAGEVNKFMFQPELKTPIKTLDLPIAGRGYSAQTLPLVFDLINLANEVTDETELQDDSDGTTTVAFLKKTKSIVERISSTHSACLGLHPVVYFYSVTGRYQPTAFFAIVVFIQYLEKNKLLDVFSHNRGSFEEFLLKQKQLVNQVTLKYGSGLKGYRRLSELYKLILDLVVARSSEESIITAIKTDERFKDYIQLDNEADGEAVTKDFSIGTKSAAFLRDALSAPIKCKICHGLIHMNSITFDHIQRKEDGGIGNIENAQLAHPYCNNILKN